MEYTRQENPIFNQPTNQHTQGLNQDIMQVGKQASKFIIESCRVNHCNPSHLTPSRSQRDTAPKIDTF